MDEGKKKTVMIGVIVGCVVVAGAVTFMTRSGGSSGLDSIPDEETVWVTCRNPACTQNYEMSKKEYYRQLEEAGKENPGLTLVAPPLSCAKCSEPSLYLAYKCPKCDTVYEGNQVTGDFVDRCPKEGCGYSAIEEGRKAAARGGS